MDEQTIKKLMKISFLVSLVGIFFLLLLSNIIKPKQINLPSELKLNSYASTSGKILSIKNYDDFLIIKLDNNIALIFNCKNCNLKQNLTIKTEGKVVSYKNELQIQAEKIKISIKHSR